MKGHYAGAATIFHAGGTSAEVLSQPSPRQMAFVSRLTSSGTVSWTARIYGSTGERSFGIAIDSSNNVRHDVVICN